MPIGVEYGVRLAVAARLSADGEDRILHTLSAPAGKSPAKADRVTHASFPKLAAGERVKLELQIGLEKRVGPLLTP